MKTKAKSQNSKSKTSMLEDHTFTRSFTPLLSKKDGCSRLTYAGYVHSCRKDGNNPFIKLIFTCRDITHKSPANISILSSYRISKVTEDSEKMNKVTRSMLAMGYQFPQSKFVTLDKDDDEFGHGVVEDEGFNDSIYEFLKEARGLVYKAILEQDDKGFYRIQIESLKPLLDKKGAHLRDYEADQAIESDDLSIDIEDSELN
jgi:hypothetical protein